MEFAGNFNLSDGYLLGVQSFVYYNLEQVTNNYLRAAGVGFNYDYSFYGNIDTLINDKKTSYQLRNSFNKDLASVLVTYLSEEKRKNRTDALVKEIEDEINNKATASSSASKQQVVSQLNTQIKNLFSQKFDNKVDHFDDLLAGKEEDLNEKKDRKTLTFKFGDSNNNEHFYINVTTGSKVFEKTTDKLIDDNLTNLKILIPYSAQDGNFKLSFENLVESKGTADEDKNKVRLLHNSNGAKSSSVYFEREGEERSFDIDEENKITIKDYTLAHFQGKSENYGTLINNLFQLRMGKSLSRNFHYCSYEKFDDAFKRNKGTLKEIKDDILIYGTASVKNDNGREERSLIYFGKADGLYDLEEIKFKEDASVLITGNDKKILDKVKVKDSSLTLVSQKTKSDWENDLRELIFLNPSNVKESFIKDLILDSSSSKEDIEKKKTELSSYYTQLLEDDLGNFKKDKEISFLKRQELHYIEQKKENLF